MAPARSQPVGTSCGTAALTWPPVPAAAAPPCCLPVRTASSVLVASAADPALGPAAAAAAGPRGGSCTCSCCGCPLGTLAYRQGSCCDWVSCDGSIRLSSAESSRCSTAALYTPSYGTCVYSHKDPISCVLLKERWRLWAAQKCANGLLQGLPTRGRGYFDALWRVRLSIRVG